RGDHRRDGRSRGSDGRRNGVPGRRERRRSYDLRHAEIDRSRHADRPDGAGRKIRRSIGTLQTMTDLFDIRPDALSVDECIQAVSHSSAGGTSVFIGTVRDENDGRAVTLLEYEA